MNKVVLVVGTVVTVLVCLLLGLLLSSKTDREPESEPSETGKKLENDEMCGITTGGQASSVCWESSEI